MLTRSAFWSILGLWPDRPDADPWSTRSPSIRSWPTTCTKPASYEAGPKKRRPAPSPRRSDGPSRRRGCRQSRRPIRLGGKESSTSPSWRRSPAPSGCRSPGSSYPPRAERPIRSLASTSTPRRWRWTSSVTRTPGSGISPGSMALIGAPRSILHDELLGSAGYPGADEWAGIDDKREELLRAALEQFASAHERPRRIPAGQPDEAEAAHHHRVCADVPPQARRRLLASQQPRRR